MHRIASSRAVGVQIIAFIALLSTIACDTQATGGKVIAEPAAINGSSPGEALSQPYPPGRWRLARSEELTPVVLWVSHILIRHESVAPGVVSFNLGDWTPAPAAPSRTRKQAFELAQQAAAEIRPGGQNFADVARQYSEDVATREQGGSLGCISAEEFAYRWPEVLDVLSAIHPGQASRVVETGYGFHVFIRRAPPPLETVSGVRIVVGYDQAPWLHTFLARWPIPKRHRQEALQLAETLYRRALAGEPFEQLVAEHSDHQEALRGGDFGAWVTQQRGSYPREVEVLQGLEEGEIAPPMDTTFGVQIIKRTPLRQRAVYAMTSVQQRFDASLPDSEPASRSWVSSNVQQLSDSVAADPASFERLQAQYCCTRPEQWEEGQGPAAAELALAGLLPGQIAPKPVDLGYAMAIVRRVMPSERSELITKFELPMPESADVGYLVRDLGLTTELVNAARRARDELGLEQGLGDKFIQLHEQAIRGEEQDGKEQRAVRFAELQDKLKELLGGPRYATYTNAMTSHFDRYMYAFLSDSKTVVPGPVQLSPLTSQ